MSQTQINPLWSLDRELFVADGEPHVFNDTLYLYGSRDVLGGLIDGVSAWCSEDYHVVRSKDLINWEDCGKSFSLEEIPEEHLQRDRAPRLWAPDACYNPKDGKYYLFSCLNLRAFFVSSSASPEGPFTNTRKMTIDGQDTFPETIDPGVLVDDDGKAYIAWPNAKERGWHIAQLNPDDFSDVIGETIRPVGNVKWPFEGPSIRKRGDTYYYIYIQNDGPRVDGNIGPLRMAYMTSKNPLGPYEDQGVIIETSDYPHAINIHGSIVEWKGQWYVFYHLPLQGVRNTRFACAAPLEFNDDGTIVEAKPVSCGPRHAFALREVIPAYTAVVYSKARGDRPANYSNQQEQRCDFSDKNDRHLFFDRVGQFAGWRYVDFGEGHNGTLKLSVQSPSPATIEIRADEHDGQLLATVAVDASDAYAEYEVAYQSRISHRHTVFAVLKSREKAGRVKMESLTL